MFFLSPATAHLRRKVAAEVMNRRVRRAGKSLDHGRLAGCIRGRGVEYHVHIPARHFSKEDGVGRREMNLKSPPVPSALDFEDLGTIPCAFPTGCLRRYIYELCRQKFHPLKTVVRWPRGLQERNVAVSRLKQ